MPEFNNALNMVEMYEDLGMNKEDIYRELLSKGHTKDIVDKCFNEERPKKEDDVFGEDVEYQCVG
ncbi:hypothetical protein [Bacillus wiedmannii]|uniref:Uncharacterized protein n=1 Tax=Bacillus wiedmannii TaxID=1890302 RepID=A0A2A8BSX1_9BACI|nr:hypothetical protein [Bacillus wiedmannii]PEM57631.1 hypothetical protein CN611_07415 [Bacillus wiedmannii]